MDFESAELVLVAIAVVVVVISADQLMLTPLASPTDFHKLNCCNST
uniref:Uncharacterized protein n=1 Tax=Rhizophora mucronata TaxID=61149 RepID=A0A2P2PQY1_RHIMU